MFEATTGTAVNTVYSGNINGYSGTSITTNGTVGMGCSNPSERLTVSGTTINPGLTLQGNSTINYSINQNSNNMAPRQVNVAVFTITRDVDTNEINGTKFVKQLWVEQKNGASIDLIVAKELDKDFDPETTVIKILTTVSF
jgi:hypothetical protein